MTKPKNVIFIVADSLRYDSLSREADFGLPYISSHATFFRQARSAGSWTLPSTSSMFTGCMPHEHHATTHIRQINLKLPTLAEELTKQGYRGFQVSANPATTDIFGLDRGFEKIHKVWQIVPQKHSWVDGIIAIVAKPRLKRKLFSHPTDLIAGKMTEDIKSVRAWVQSNHQFQFDLTHDILKKTNQKGDGAFVFVNLMESHFPYHIDDTLKLLSKGLLQKLQEIRQMYHFSVQTRLKEEHSKVTSEILAVIRERQRIAWKRLAPKVDEFTKGLHQDGENLVVFCSDHGDCFGDFGWEYHFSNVNDGGNKVPLFILPPGQKEAKSVSTEVSLRDIYGTLIARTGGNEKRDKIDLLDAPEASSPVLQSFWYNKDGQTRDEFKYNQFAFAEAGRKFIHRKDRWLCTEYSEWEEKNLQPFPTDSNPLEDIAIEPERRAFLKKSFADFLIYSKQVLKDS